ncbi:hypothetical protein K4K58_006189 [Colletotrichum sp. SAR11_239]|nr:hypothetical protein K4K52_002864 [Colletotrichum sp. SAR 10_76]KAI8268099.1 hypothetical protein K4K58_006189 [Colletotrichum sp. SAR11_239]KAJ4998379.1 hypothetical protein K4K48_005570 [Colletotrichum sp. SAR 10_66]
MNHDYTKGQMIGLAVGFMIIPTIFYVLRIWAKLLVKRFALDDYLAGFALPRSMGTWANTNLRFLTGHRSWTIQG